MSQKEFDEGFDAGWMSCVMALRIAYREKITIGEALRKLDPEEVIHEMGRLR